MKVSATMKSTVEVKKRAIIISSGRLIFVPLTGGERNVGTLLTITQVANLMQVPPDRVVRWINKGKVMSPIQLSILERQERPDGYIKRNGAIRETDRERFNREQASVLDEHIKAGRTPSLNDIYEEAVKRCLQRFKGWTRKYIEEFSFFIREENPNIRKKAPGLKVRMRAQAQRRAHLKK